MIKVGAITVGQSPRVDVTKDLIPIIKDQVELVEIGALDDLTKEEISLLKPSEDEYVLVSRLRDGTSVTFSEEKILPKLQVCIETLEQQGVELIVFFCSGEFPVTFRSNVPLIYPSVLQMKIIPRITNGRLNVFVPSKEQLSQIHEKFLPITSDLNIISINPYDGLESFKQAFDALDDLTGSLNVLDCIGYTDEMSVYAQEKSNILTISARKLAGLVMIHTEFFEQEELLYEELGKRITEINSQKY